MPDPVTWDSLSNRRTPPPEPPAWRKALGPLLGAAFAVWKWGLPLLKFAPVMLKSGGSMILSVGLYAVFFGWKYAVGLVLLLLVHELGHALVARIFGIRTSAPVFVPFMGAHVILRDTPQTAFRQSMISLGGPALGGFSGFFCFGMGAATGEPIWFALAHSAFLLNLFNLLPIVPFDGGHAVAALSPWLWVVGLAVLIPYLVLNFSTTGLIVGILVLFSLPRVWSLFTERNNPEYRRYFEATSFERVVIGFAYFGLIVVLAAAMGGSASNVRM